MLLKQNIEKIWTVQHFGDLVQLLQGYSSAQQLHESKDEAVVLKQTMPDGRARQFAIGPCYLEHPDEDPIFPWQYKQ